ncbi:phage tail protein [Pseudomonas aeruginosa]|nr:phage tail protein [Pseudomonas aeruginosa]TQF91266.1 phage tail protein [Pseudomonas aeruginosa]TQG04708.1 phage tail protein [Pseudomonas aeruginosa]TQG14061.1 phage tail protein [Pseudomonas aeruginosa]TQG24407.1 phage tail protein [Pseudomonas aeruginosa]
MADVRPTKLQNDGNGYGSLREFTDGDTVPLAMGGTGAATAAGARTSLGLGSAAVRSALGSTGALYSRDSILGAVSQSSGVPTGAVIDRGSNANGEYVRFADGTQVCWAERALTVTTAAAGSIHVDGAPANGLWAYPATFSSPPNTHCNARHGGMWANALVATPNSVTSIVMSTVARSSVAVNVAFTAIGRWF